MRLNARSGAVTVALAVAASTAVPLLAPATANAATDCVTHQYVTDGRPDFDLDGVADEVYPEPDRTVDGLARAGAVRVVLSCGGRHTVLLTAASVGSTPVAGGRFGAAVRALPLDPNDFDDLVIGSPGAPGGGRAWVLWGDNGDLGSATYRPTLTLAPPSGAGVAGFGAALDAGRFSFGDGDNGEIDVVVGAPGTDASAKRPNSGAAFRFRQSDNDGDPVTPVRTTWRRGHGGVPGKERANDRFGSVVDVSGVNGDLQAYVGAPHEAVKVDGRLRPNAGAVYAFNTSRPGAVRITQQSAGVPGGAESGDRFGAALDSWSLALAVGAPGESLGRGKKHAGSAYAFRVGIGSNGDANSRYTGARVFTQDSRGVAGKAESGDHLGSSVAVRFTVHEHQNVLLAAGAPGERVGRREDAGAVTLFGRTRTCAAVTSACGRTFTLETRSVPGALQTGARFGATISTSTDDGSAEDAVSRLVVGVPRYDVAGLVDAGRLLVIGLGGKGQVLGTGKKAHARVGRVLVF